MTAEEASRAFNRAAVHEALCRRGVVEERVADEPKASAIEAAERVYVAAKRKSDVAYCAWKSATADGPCRAPATLIVFRGRERRLFLCTACRHTYTGSGEVSPYETDVLGVEKSAGAFSGPARVCGEETGA